MSSSAVRGGVLVALAALLGFLILQSVESRVQVPVSEIVAQATPTPIPTAEVGAEVGATAQLTPTEVVDLGTARPNSHVSVLVANGTDVSGQARRHTDTLRNLGFNVRPPKNAAGGVEFSVIYYRPGFEVEAQVVRESLNSPETKVAPLPDPEPDVGPAVDLGGVDVFVLIGNDELAT